MAKSKSAASKKIAAAKAPRKPRTKKPAAGEKKPTRHEQLDALLRSPDGVTIQQIVDAFGVQSHSARALISVLAKKLGVKVATSRTDKEAPLVYRLPAAK